MKFSVCVTMRRGGPSREGLVIEGMRQMKCFRFSFLMSTI